MAEREGLIRFAQGSAPNSRERLFAHIPPLGATHLFPFVKPTICAVRKWRRGRDSNPRDPRGPNGFQDRRNRPLCHLSEDASSPTFRESRPMSSLRFGLQRPISNPQSRTTADYADDRDW